MRDFIDPKHLLVRVDANFDFASFVSFLQSKYTPLFGRPAIHPEVIVRALILVAIYGVDSNRQLCERISENIAWRWFCHLTLQDQVFDHSTLSAFQDRVKSEGFQEILNRLNADSSLVEANVRAANLPSTELSPQEFSKQATEKDGIYTIRNKKPANPQTGQLAGLECLRYQDNKGKLPLSPVDPEARWRRPNKNRRAIFGYKENVIVDKSGFIMARGVIPADVRDIDGVTPLLDQLPFLPKSLCADAGYRAGKFRQMLRLLGITPYIPLSENQEETANTALATGDFTYHGDHLICRHGKTLRWMGFPDDHARIQYVSSPTDCQDCPHKMTCLPAKENRKHVRVSRYEYEFRRARRLNETVRYEQEIRRRKTVVEGVFARLDRLSWDRARFIGIEKLNCQGYIAAIGHNILKALTKVRFWKRGAAVMASNSFVDKCYSFFKWLLSTLYSYRYQSHRWPSNQTLA